MVFRRIILKRPALPTAVVGLVAGVTLYPQQIAWAESIESHSPIAKKPIYEDAHASDSSPSKSTLPTPSKTLDNPPQPRSPTITDRLAVHIRSARLTVYENVSSAEDKVNNILTEVLHLENSFTSTISSLRPPPSSGERLLPGSVYVLVSAMTGSILTRNRNILFRFSVPLAIGVGAGWVVLPITMRNVGDLAWTYEEKVPALADAHLRTRRSLEDAWRFSKVHAQLGAKKVEEGVNGARQEVEKWVSGKE